MTRILQGNRAAWKMTGNQQSTTCAGTLSVLFTIPNFITAGSGRAMLDIIERLDRTVQRDGATGNDDRATTNDEVAADWRYE